jgi:hypothetical protein
VSGALKVSENRVQLENWASVSELGGDYSSYSGSKIKTLFDVSKDAPGCQIASVSIRADRFRGFDYHAANDPRYFTFNTMVPQTEPYVYNYMAAKCNTVNYQVCKVGWKEIDFTVYLGPLTNP